MFFVTFVSLFSLIVYLVRFNTNNKHHFLHNFSFNLSMFTEEDGTTINKKEKRILKKMLKGF